MFAFLLIVQTLVAGSLVGVILMQRSEGGGLGVGGSSSGFMTARGAADFLTRSTAVLGGMFIVLSIVMAAIAGATRQPATKHAPADAERLNPWYYSDAPKTMRPVLDTVRRQSTFDEVVQGLDEKTALFEARRCLSCGNCFECDNCYGVCPDNAVVKLGPGDRFAFNYDYCKGCGVCVAECPSGAIEMVPEDV